MVSRYSIIQYVPDPIAGERINFGVIAFDDDQIQVRFLENWKRVHCFSQENIEFLKDFTNRMKGATSSGLMVPGEEPSDLTRQERLLKISHDWQNSIQITSPRKSLGEVELVANQISGLFLKEPLQEVKSTLRDRQAAAKIAKISHDWQNSIQITSPRKSLGEVELVAEKISGLFLKELLQEVKSTLRDRQAAAKIAKIMVRDVLKKRFKPDLVKSLLNKINELPGKRESHRFDATVMNGKPYFAVQGISFEIHPPKHTTESVSWMISDVRDSNSDIPLGVLVLPPKRNTEKYDELLKLYEQKTELYKDQGATIIKEQDLGEWADRQLTIISAH